MWNKGYYFIGLVLFFWACNKEDLVYDREEHLPTDTISFMNSFDYSAGNNLANVNLSFLTFNGLTSESNFSDYSITFIPPYDNAPFVYNLNATSEVSGLNYSNYSHIIVLEEGLESWYSSHNFGIFLRRYLEETANLNRKIALASFNPENQSNLVFFNKDEGSVFNNPWEDNLELFYEKSSLYGNNSESISYVVQRINEAIDEFVNSSEILPNKSITAVIPNYFYNTDTDSTLIANLITRANSEAISINIVGENIIEEIKTIAFQTNGFVFDNPEQLDFNNSKSTITPVGCLIENLDKILAKNYTYQTFDFTIIDTTGQYFMWPGDIQYFSLDYNNQTYYYQIKS
ncbi:MAG: hypothetical protein ACWA41_02980 [Putridiphycobacter sp.]